MDVTDSHGNCPLWQALDSGQEDIAHILVSLNRYELLPCLFKVLVVHLMDSQGPKLSACTQQRP